MTQLTKVRTVTGLAVAGLLVGGAAMVAAHARQATPAQPGPQARAARAGGPMMRRGPLGALRRGLAQLGLSDLQRQQVKSILGNHRTEFRGFADQVRTARRGVADAIAGDQPETVIREKCAELARVQADLAVFGARVRKEVFAVLTPDQQAKAAQLRLQAREKGKGKI
jgi:Spy/CpxP family protein refolding chaperone